jgi:hypothetical protein
MSESKKRSNSTPSDYSDIEHGGRKRTKPSVDDVSCSTQTGNSAKVDDEAAAEAYTENTEISTPFNPTLTETDSNEKNIKPQTEQAVDDEKQSSEDDESCSVQTLPIDIPKRPKRRRKSPEMVVSRTCDLERSAKTTLAVQQRVEENIGESGSMRLTFEKLDREDEDGEMGQTELMFEMDDV